MFSRSFYHKNLSCSAIALVLLASLPQVVCCCNVSWGPAGLLSRLADYPELPAATTSCCDCHAPTPPADASVPQQVCDKGHCTYSAVDPLPMSVRVTVDRADADWDDAGHSEYLAAAPIGPANRASAGESATMDGLGCPVLTPLSRCALLQTWRI